MKKEESEKKKMEIGWKTDLCACAKNKNAALKF